MQNGGALRRLSATRLQPWVPAFLQTTAYAVVVAFRRGPLRTGKLYTFNLACRLVYIVKRLWVRDYIVAYPDLPRPNHMTWVLSMLSGYRMVHLRQWRQESTVRPPLAYLCHRDADHQEFDDLAINGRCVDITKRHVDHVFRSTFGYSPMIDPTSYHGRAVCKPDANARNTERFIECPIDQSETDPDCVYQRPIYNQAESGLSKEVRLCIFGDQISEVLIAYCDVNTIGRRKAWIHKGDGPGLLDDAERAAIIRFCHRLGLEIGELDVLRDQIDGRIYVIDANKTASNPGKVMGRAWAEFGSCYRRRVPAFRRYLEERAGTVRSPTPDRRIDVKPSKRLALK